MGGAQKLLEMLNVGNEVIGGEHDHHRLWVAALDGDGSQADHRGGAAGQRLQDEIFSWQRRALLCQHLSLLPHRHHVDMVRREEALQPFDGGLEEAVFRDQAQHLLGAGLA